MNELIPIETSQAEHDFAVANTPLFLLRKLKANDVPKELATKYSSEEIIASLGNSLRRAPSSLSETVQPYLYLVALSFFDDIAPLQIAASMAAPHHDWFPYLAKVLVETTQSRSFSRLFVQGQIVEPLITFGPATSSNVTPTIIKVSD